MGEYAYDFTGENIHDGNSRNPHDTTRMSGGSSGGSGSAVAGGEVTLSLGSDTNGSIRVPSSLCGLFGLKPTYGRLPRNRSFPFVDSFDHLGPIARSPPDGYNLLVSANSMADVPVIYGNAPYDWKTAFQPISHIQAVPAVLVVHPSSPIKTLADFIKIGRETPAKLAVADSGVGTTHKVRHS
jgi:hypothetical protein